MKVGGKQRGFTIIETLIVLAVSGGLFVMVAVAVSGRQVRSEFEQSAQDVRSQIQQAINEVSSGFYPNSSNFSCTASGAGPVLATGTTEQGSNTDCIFLGKVLQFDIASTTPEQFVVYPVAALRQTAAGADVSTLAEAQPKVIAPTTSAPAAPNASERKKLLYGLTTQSMVYGPTATPTNIGAVAFLSTMASYSGSSILSGSQQLNVYPIPTTALNATTTAGATAINSALQGSPANPADGVRICFRSGGTNDSARITIGGSVASQLTVDLKIFKGTTTCG